MSNQFSYLNPQSIQVAAPCNQNLNLDFPIYSHGNPMDWISKAEYCFEYYQIPYDQRKDIADMHFKGDARPWFKTKYPASNWPQFVEAFLGPFGTKGVMDVNETLSRLEQGLQVDHTAHIVRGFAPAGGRDNGGFPNSAPGVTQGVSCNVGEGGTSLEPSLFRGELSEKTKRKLIKECSKFKEQLSERENELLSLYKTHQVDESEASVQIKEFKNDARNLKINLKLELETFYTQKREFKEQTEHKAKKAEQLEEENLGLLSKFSEHGIGSKDNELEVSGLMKKDGNDERKFQPEFGRLIAKSTNMQVELDSLGTQKGDFESSLDPGILRLKLKVARVSELMCKVKRNIDKTMGDMSKII